MFFEMFDHELILHSWEIQHFTAPFWYIKALSIDNFRSGTSNKLKKLCQCFVDCLLKMAVENHTSFYLLICHCSSDKENHEPCWSGSLAGNSVPEIEVAEVAYTADEE